VGATSTVVENAPKTEASRRTLPLDQGLLAVLRRAKTKQAEERLRIGAAYADSGYVAANEAGLPYTPGVLTHNVARPGGDSGCAANQAARCPALLRDGDAPSGCSAGGHQ
jgi:hypothetical protein